MGENKEVSLYFENSMTLLPANVFLVYEKQPC